MIDRKLIEDFFLRLEKVQGIEREIKIEPIEGKVKCIVGPRKSGKTWLFLMLSRGELYVNLFDIAFKDMETREFFEVIKIYSKVFGRSVKKIFIDEVQELKGWEYLVLSLLNRNYEVFVTGSSSKILKKEFSTSLRGKNIVKILLPFSFREYLKAENFREDVRTFEGAGKILRLAEEYLLNGAYPEVVLNKERKETLWRSYFEEIFYRDFVERHKVRNLELGRTVLEFVFQNFSNLMSVNRIKNFLKGRVPFTAKTLYEYVEGIEDTLNVFFVKKYSEKIYERMSWPRKVYVVDTGIVNLVLRSKDLGRRMENCVFLELLRKTNQNPLLEIFYFKINEKEVDFVLKEGLRIKQLIQVTYANAKDEIERREIKSLIKASELLKCNDLLMITWDYEDELKVRNRLIKCLPLWKWLLEGNF